MRSTDCPPDTDAGTSYLITVPLVETGEVTPPQGLVAVVFKATDLPDNLNGLGKLNILNDVTDAEAVPVLATEGRKMAKSPTSSGLKPAGTAFGRKVRPSDSARRGLFWANALALTDWTPRMDIVPRTGS